MPIKITVEESDDKAEKTTLQTSNGKSKKRDDTTLQTPKGTETEELPPAEPLAIPEDDDLKPVDTIVIKDGENYKRVHVYEVQKQAKEQEGVKCQFCKGTGKVIVEKKGIKECPRCEGEGYTAKPQAELENHKDDQQIDDITQEEEMQGGIQPETEEQIEQDNSENEMEDFQEEQEPEDSDFGEPEEEKVNTKAFESFVGKKIQVLKQRHPDKAVTLLMGTEVNGDYGSKKIKGTLAYAGVSLNDRIYLPEELAKGDGMTLPLLLNHSSTAGAEGELYRLQDDARQALEGGKDYKVGEVTLTWKPEALTLYYEGEVDHPFFQKEVDEADMAVSLGIYYDSDSPMLCNDQCYTVIKGAEFREVSLVYHAGFPVATIEAYEKLLKKKAMESMKGEPNINPEKANEGNYIYDCDYCNHHEEAEYPDIEGHLKNIHGITDHQDIKQARNDLQRDETTFDPFEEEMLPKWREVESKIRSREGLSKEELEQRISELQNYLEHAITQEIPVMPKMRKMLSLIEKMKKINPSYTNSWWDNYGIDSPSRVVKDFSIEIPSWRLDESKANESDDEVIGLEFMQEIMEYIRHLHETNLKVMPEPSKVAMKFGISHKEARRMIDKFYNMSDKDFRISGWGKENVASEWTPSQGHDWQPPTDKDYKDLPKPDKNQKMAGSHDEPKYRGKNRDTDGKFSKETEYEEEIIPDYNVGSRVKVSGDNDNEGYDGFRDKVLIVTHVATSRQEHMGFDEGVGQALYDLKTLDGEDIGSSLYDYELESA